MSYTCPNCKKTLQAEGDHKRWCDYDFATAFWKRVDKDSHPKGCWIWTGYVQRFGHGWLGSRRGLAHRYAWTLLRGPLEKGECLLHTCDEPACVNPDHCYLGDRSKNSKDMWLRGRAPTKLSPEKVIEIRAAFQGVTGRRVIGALQHKLAAKHGVSAKTIWAIRTNPDKWRHAHPGDKYGS